MTDLFAMLEQLQVGTLLRAILLISLGYITARILSTSVAHALQKRITRQQSLLLRRFTFYIIFALFITSAIQQLGFHITALLGATGILTVALGIASQTSMANIVSGIFIIGEKPFEVGDFIKVNGIEGEVMSIDLLSAKIRTDDNMMVRLPNEILVKSPITNISYYPNRRIHVLINISHKEDLNRVKSLLLHIAKSNALTLKDHEPTLSIKGLNDFAISIKLSLWTLQKNVQEAKNSIQEDIKSAFEQAEIDIPYRNIFLNNQAEL